MTGKLTKEQFITFITKCQENTAYIEKVCKIFPTFWDTDIVDYGWYMFESLMEAYFDQDGVEWIDWWLFERPDSDGPQAWDENNEVIPTSTVEDLWNIVKNYLK